VSSASSADTVAAFAVEKESLIRVSLEKNDPIPVSANINSPKERQQIVETLHRRFKSIEGVSVVLRFLYPEKFGILSLPVVHLINLAPEKKPVEYYLEYLGILSDLREHYGARSKSLQRIADIDMALWSAAHFWQDRDLPSEYASLKNSIKAMFRDDYFQELRFKNMLKGLQGNLKLTDLQHLVFARSLLEHDPLIAAAVAARPYDSLVHRIAKEFDIDESYLDEKSGERQRKNNKQIIDELREKHRDRIFPKFGMTCGELDKWRVCRNRAVHENERPVEKNEADMFVKGVAEALKRIAVST